MKRVKITALVHDDMNKDEWVHPRIVEVENYDEKMIPVDKDITDEYSFDSLIDALKDMANGVWIFIKGFAKSTAWAFVLVIEGFKYLWKHGVDKKKEDVKIVNNGGSDGKKRKEIKT
jgi:hypothetical protein